MTLVSLGSGGSGSSRRPHLGIGTTMVRVVVVFAGVAFMAATLAASVLFPRPVADMVVRVDAELAGAVGIGVAAWTGWRSQGDERRWRLLVAGCLVCLQVPLSGLVKAAVEGHVFPVVALPYVVPYLLWCVLVLAAILHVPGTSPREWEHLMGAWGRSRYVIIVLDSMLVVGSLIVLDRMAVLKHAVADHTRLTVFFVGDGSMMIVVVAALLLPSFRVPRSPGSFALLAGGVVAHALSASTFLYIVGRAWPDVAPLLVTGLVAGSVLMALACLIPPPDPDETPDQAGPWGLWLHVALSYLPVGVVAVVALVQLPTRRNLDEADVYGLLLLLLVALARQIILLMENRRLLGLVRYQALHDPLTGLANRALFLDRLTRAATRHSRDGRALALLFYDLDDFKDVNDRFGHAAGDELLLVTAKRLAGAVRSADTAARLGGDEFGVVFEGVRDDPEAVARRVVEAVCNSPVSVGAWQCPVRLSAGLVIVESDGGHAGPVTPDTLLRRADIAMYTAKRRDKGGLVVCRRAIEEDVPNPLG